MLLALNFAILPESGFRSILWLQANYIRTLWCWYEYDKIENENSNTINNRLVMPLVMKNGRKTIIVFLLFYLDE